VRPTRPGAGARVAAGGLAAIPRHLRYYGARARALRALFARRGTMLVNLDAGGRADLTTIQATRALVPLLMHDAAALQIMLCVRAVTASGGAMAEAGVFMGGSARLICAAKGEVPLHLFDAFETLQQPAAPAAEADEEEVRRHFGTLHARQDQVARLLAGHRGVHFHPGLFPASTRGLEGERFAFVHVDLDLPRGIADALDFFHPRMVPGGILLIDDYADAAVRTTVQAWFAGRRDTIVALPWNQAMVIRQGD
jgi:O-methyltransferase